MITSQEPEPNPIHQLIESQYKESKEKAERLREEYKRIDLEYFHLRGLLICWGVELK